MKSKSLFLKIVPLVVPSTAIFLASCGTQADFSIEPIQPGGGFETIGEITILDQLADKVFGKKEVEKFQFLEQQKNSEYIQKTLAEIKQQADIVLVSKKSEDLKKLKQLFSKNWYLVLKNINKFEFKFYDWYALGDLGNRTNRFSEKYSKYLKTLNPYQPSQYNGTNIEEGEEAGLGVHSNQMSDIFLLIEKTFLVFRIRKEAGATDVALEPLNVYFDGKEPAPLKYFRDAYHSGIMHNRLKDVYQFEQEIMDSKTPTPAWMLLIPKSDKNAI
ncbi:aromatic motif membrane protein [Candidatus Mycoplasma pogonae]